MTINIPEGSWILDTYTYPNSSYYFVTPDIGILKRYAAKKNISYVVSLHEGESLELVTIYGSTLLPKTVGELCRRIAKDEVKKNQIIHIVIDWLNRMGYIFPIAEDAYTCCNNLIEMNAKGATESTALVVYNKEVV